MWSVTYRIGFVPNFGAVGTGIQTAAKVDKQERGLESAKTDVNSQGWRLGFSWPRALSIQPKIPEISVGTSKGTDHFGLVRPKYSGPALKVVHFDRSGYLGRSDRNVPFHLKNCCPQYRSFVSSLQEQWTNEQVAWVGSVQTECVHWARGISEISRRKFYWMESVPKHLGQTLRQDVRCVWKTCSSSVPLLFIIYRI